MTDFFEPLTPPNLGAPKPRKHRHRWVNPMSGGSPVFNDPVCAYCGCHPDGDAQKRGRNNRARGNAIEREVARKLGMKRVGQYGGPDDARGSLFAAQVKSGVAYPERLHRWLKAVPVNAGQTAILVVTDAPGPGKRRRGLVILDLDDWRDLHGETGA